MSRAKTRHPGTRSGEPRQRAESVGPTGAFPQAKRRPPATAIPEDLADAAEAALDDLLATADAIAARELEITAEPADEQELEALGARKRPPPPPGAPAPITPRRAQTPKPHTISLKDAPRARVAAPEAKPTPSARARATIDDAQLVEETVLPVISSLRFAVWEDEAHLGGLTDAIAATGHENVISVSGAARLPKILDAVVGGTLDVVIVSIPGGEAVIDAALALEPRRPVVIAALAGSSVDAVRRATSAGADLAIARPHDLERLAPMLLAVARLHAERRIAQNARGNELVLRAKLDEISDPEPRGLQPFEVFQRVLELEFKRARRFEYPLSVALFAVEVTPPPPPAGIRGILRARAGNALIHTIRDIDLATQLDHERFLVLLPYTDLTGAAGLARRVIAAVAAGDPVTSGGRSFPPRVVGAVAGARPGQPVSFAKLMKDSTRALEQARRDGAELAVEP